MQFNGIGQGHDSERHHVTNCMYDHTHYRKREESANSGGGSMEAQAMEMMRRSGLYDMLGEENFYWSVERALLTNRPLPPMRMEAKV